MFKILANEKAMTLIEILIAMAILAVLTLSTTMSLRRSVTLKKKIKTKINRQGKFRSALRLIDRDIRLAFNYRDITYDIYADIKKREQEILNQNNSNSNSNTNSGSGSAGSSGGSGSSGSSGSGTNNNNTNNTSNLSLLDLEKYNKDLKDPTSFYGEKDELHFTNTNSVKVSADDMGSIQQEVGYYVKNCRNRINPELSYNCLWRRVNKIIDDKVEQGGDEFVVLENITVFKLRYYGETKEDWVPTWFSGERGDDDTRDRFPKAVEISISFKEGEKVEEAVMVSHIAFPNNEVIEDTPSETQ